VIGPATLTAAEYALSECRALLASAHSAEVNNVRLCINYLKTAKTALEGLHGELDEILTQACWLEDSPEARRALGMRIDVYLHHDRLRPRLIDAVEGIGACYVAARHDGQGILGFFRGGLKADALDDLEDSWNQLNEELQALSCAAESGENLFSGSGIQAEVLHQISGMLREKKSSWKIRDAAERARQARGAGAARWGGPATALMTRLIHAFMVGEDKA